MTTLAAPDHDADAARADNAIRSLDYARRCARDAARELADLPGCADALASLAEALTRIDAATARETAARDAAELAARAARTVVVQAVRA